MQTSETNPASRTSEPLHDFDRVTSKWGPITMIAGLIAMIGGPAWLAVFGDYQISGSALLLAVAAIAAFVGFIWIIEPLSYYPILGPAAMYQAFLIGNISTKLLPATVSAQNEIGAKPGSPQAQLAATAAICSAVVIHVASLVIIVGVLGTWLLAVLPPDLLDAVATYVVPAVLGAFVIQMLTSNLDKPRLIIGAIVLAAVLVFVIAPIHPLLSMFTPLLGVILTATLAMLWKEKPAGASQD